MRKPIYGFGINDADYNPSPSQYSKYGRCPYYQKWKGMIERAYSAKHKVRFPSYTGVTVCEEWRYFSNFKKWMETQDWKGKHLDKDIKVEGNKVYSPDTCLFVSPEINNLFLEYYKKKTDLPTGVCLFKRTGKYISHLKKYGKRVHLGYFKTIQEAEKAYLKEKKDYILDIVKNNPHGDNDNVLTALKERAYLLNQYLAGE